MPRIFKIGLRCRRRWKVGRLFAWMHNFRRLVSRWDSTLKLPRVRPPRRSAHPAQEPVSSTLLRPANQPVELLNLCRLGVSYAPPARAGRRKEVRPVAKRTHKLVTLVKGDRLGRRWRRGEARARNF